jgi:hypothetical protein
LLQSHPFAVEAFFEHSLVLTYAYPVEKLQAMLPPPLTIDSWQSKYGFAALALVQTRGLRPKGWPAFMGRDFILAGIRLFVRYTDSRGRNLRGLYILRSTTNRRLMKWAGNLFTRYNYSFTDIAMKSEGGELQFLSNNTGIDVHITQHDTNIPLPEGTCFSNWQEARRFAGPLPFTFTWNERQNKMLIIEGVRNNWKPEAVSVIKAEAKLHPNLDNMKGILASAFLVSNIPYYWKKGIYDPWKPVNP